VKGDPAVEFEPMYQREADPWRFASSWYERRRYEITIALLPDERYGRVFEPGCSIGELTRRLSERCDSVVSWDASATAVAAARLTCEHRQNVELDVGTVPDRWPTGVFDLVVLSEIGYYVDLQGVARLRNRAIESLRPGGTMIAVHWLGRSADHVLHGDQVHEALEDPRLQHCVTHRDQAVEPEPGFRADVWRKRE
jgi:SAM-dependent methyltransferase